jgi:hypothetical protein
MPDSKAQTRIPAEAEPVKLKTPAGGKTPRITRCVEMKIWEKAKEDAGKKEIPQTLSDVKFPGGPRGAGHSGKQTMSTVKT